MSPAVEVVTELFMLVLSVIAAPADLKEFRLDLIQHSGRVETLIVQRAETGFTLLEQRGEKMIERGTIRPVPGKPATYTLRMSGAPEQSFNLAAAIQGFTVEGLQKAQTLDLKATDGVVIHLYRSGRAVYLTPEKSHTTYACH